MRFIVTILTTAIERFDAMISTFAGFLLTVAIAVFNFFVGYKVALLVVFAAVFLDMVWGIAAARKQGWFTCSELARDTFSKIGAYGTALVMTILIENLIMGSHAMGSEEGTYVRFAVDIVASIIASVEAWSICGNILIVRPNLPFFKLIRNPLVGEIARKLHISEDEVKEVFENDKPTFKKEDNNNQQTK